MVDQPEKKKRGRPPKNQQLLDSAGYPVRPDQPTKPNNWGKVRAEIDWEEFEKLCGIYCTLEEVASWFNISKSTLENLIMNRYGETFSKVMPRFTGRTAASLRRKQIQLALNGNVTMLIWLGKQLLGQKDHDDTTPEGFAISMAYDPQKRLRAIKE